MDRDTHLQAEIRSLLKECSCIPSVIPLEAYTQTAPTLHPVFRYGWLPPVWHDRNARQVIVGFCPELILNTCEALDDDDFQLYVAVRLQLLASTIAKLDDIDDATHRLRAAEDELIEQAPAVFAILSDVELYAIDEGLVHVG